jgi:uncharacterized membrane protein
MPYIFAGQQPARADLAASENDTGLNMEPARNPIQDHIDIIASHEKEFLAQRTGMERLGDSIGAFAGSLQFVGLHVTGFTAWILVNTLHVRNIRHFDPFPFGFLGTVVALEGILLASFILMRQARLGRRADERDHLILQMLILTEREITASLRIDRKVAARMGIESVARDKDTEALAQHTSIDDVAQTIRDSLPSE